ncbi:CCA tRNA nucleotidyltransferase [Sulfurimonas sp.]|uniref:CCA tRNA nucleotidyltransferase n=1 Tax=Sulfurimonas sp. TaxID=2022749 RepID=UPI00260E7A21|nr:CCA tRNA nucleotidyltransferase [Sulfurimonas sp.]
MLQYPKVLDIIFDELHKKGIKPIIVGGFVRDALLNIPSADIDIELYGINSLQEVEKILAKFAKVNSVGKNFGICKLIFHTLDLDFSLPRKDNKIAQGHQGFEVSIDTSLNFRDASSRRDFTINAMGYDVQKKELLDPFSGLEDLKNHLLRAVDLKKFDEDPLRVLRAIMFASRFNLHLDALLFQKCKMMMHDNVLLQLPRERIFDEIKKILLKSPKPSLGFRLLKEIDGFIFFQEFKNLSDEKYNLILQSLDVYSKQSSKDEKTNLIIFFSLLSSKFTYSQTQSFLSKITNDKELIKSVLLLTQTQLSLENYNNYTLYKLACKVNISLYLRYLKALHHNKKNDLIHKISKTAKALHIYNQKAKPLILGRDLQAEGLKASKEFGIILNAAYEAQMREEFKDKQEAIIWLKNYLSSSKFDKTLP